MRARLDRWLSDLFRAHHCEVVRYAARLVGDRDNGEEVVQNAWLRMSRLNSTAAIDHPRAYLFTAARNAAVDFTLRQNREWTYRIDLDDLGEAAVSADTIEDIFRRQRIARLAVVLNELPRACQTAFVMNKIEGRSHAEIAKQLGVSVSMVEKHIMRALIHCRDRMREGDDDFAAWH